MVLPPVEAASRKPAPMGAGGCQRLDELWGGSRCLLQSRPSLGSHPEPRPTPSAQRGQSGRSLSPVALSPEVGVRSLLRV